MRVDVTLAVLRITHHKIDSSLLVIPAMSFELQRWIRCPECGEEEMVGCRSYRASFVVQCHECSYEEEIEVGDRPLHKLRSEDVERKPSL